MANASWNPLVFVGGQGRFLTFMQWQLTKHTISHLINTPGSTFTMVLFTQICGNISLAEKKHNRYQERPLHVTLPEFNKKM